MDLLYIFNCIRTIKGYKTKPNARNIVFSNLRDIGKFKRVRKPKYPKNKVLRGQSIVNQQII